MHKEAPSSMLVPVLPWILALAIPLLILIIHSFYYYPYFVDDAFITMRYAERLLEGKGLTWNDHDRVEGYSDLLWLLLIAAFGWLGFDLLAAARAVSMLASIATMLAFAYYATQVVRAGSKALLYGGMCFALAAPVAIWSLAGLECTLVMALMAWVFVLSLRLLHTADNKAAIACGCLLALVCLTRPEGPVLTIALATGLFICTIANRRAMLSPLFILCAIPASVYLAQVGFRFWYYGEIFSNTVHAKMAWTSSRLLNGFIYCIKGIAVFLPLLLLVLLKLDKLKQDTIIRRQGLLLLLVSSIWVVTVMLGGGDFFLGFRHMLAIVPALIFMVIAASQKLYDETGGKQYLFLGYILVCFFWLQFTFKEEHMGAKDTQYWVQEGVELGKALKDKYGQQQPLVAVGLAGVVPFYSKLPSLDMYGLTDAYLAKNPGKDFGYGFIGHDLLNADYVLSRKPDLIVFFLGRTPPLHEFAEHQQFINNYHLEHIQLSGYAANIWVRNDSKKVRP
jgi:hypothetical protein